MQTKYLWEILLLIILLLLPVNAIAETTESCSGNGSTFRVQEGSRSCIFVGQGNKVIHCTVSGLMQSAALLITSTGFNRNSIYSIPSSLIPITYNTQRLTFSGYGAKNAEINFEYFGPWDPSYSYQLTCSW